MPERSLMSRYAKPQHKAAARMLGYTLTVGTTTAWGGFSQFLATRLCIEERAALTFSSLQSLDHETAAMTSEAAMGAPSSKMPMTAFEGVMDEATFWADMAEEDELKVYTLASFNRMSPGSQAAFLSHVGRRAA